MPQRASRPGQPEQHCTLWPLTLAALTGAAVSQLLRSLAFRRRRQREIRSSGDVHQAWKQADGSPETNGCQRPGAWRATPCADGGRAIPTPGDAHEPGAHTFRPIGYLRSCFTTRNGTPRQPLLVPSARARLTLLPEVPHAALDGLSAWSHVWLIYVFHDNTEPKSKESHPELQRPAGDAQYQKGKVRVPRLNGEKVGLFATRTPHRPSPIGLSVAQVLEVDTVARTVTLGGADILDGSPVLDMKPYVPFCDAVPSAVAPPYVAAEAEEEPLAVAAVFLTLAGLKQLRAAWADNTRRTLYPTANDYVHFVCQVLSRDIRTVRQRLHHGKAAQQRNALSLASAAQLVERGVTLLRPDAAMRLPDDDGAPHADAESGVFHVVLEGVDIRYDVDSDGSVIVGGASLATALAQQHVHKHLS